jgi:hypothetical protein
VLVRVLGALLLLVRVGTAVVLVHEVLHAEEAPRRAQDLNDGLRGKRHDSATLLFLASGTEEYID